MSNKTISEILTEAKALIADPIHWTKGGFRRPLDGRNPFEIDYDTIDPKEFCFCAAGAVRQVEGKGIYSPAVTALAAVFPPAFERGKGKRYWDDIADVNDNPDTTHEQILAKFDEAIERAQIAEHLEAAKALILDPEAWTQGTYREYAFDEEIGDYTDEVSCRCAQGALYDAEIKVVYDPYLVTKADAKLREAMTEEEADRVRPNYAGSATDRHTPWFNDHKETTHADVLDLFDRAIALTKSPVEA